MKITNSLLFGAFVLAASSFLLAWDPQAVTSPNPFSVSSTTVLSSVDKMLSIRPAEVFVLLSDSDDYPDPEMASPSFLCPLNDTGRSSANRADSPAERADPPHPCGKGSITDADPGVAIDNYEALIGQGIAPTDAKQIAQITGRTGI